MLSRHNAPLTPGKLLNEPPLAWMARTGYFARGTVFLIVGAFALLAALGAGTHPKGMSGALQNLLGHAAGGALLWIVAVGLACFAGWRFLQAFFDADQFGSSIHGLVRRTAFAASGISYLALAAGIAQMTFVAHAIDDNRAARDWTHWALTKPVGRALVAAIAVGFVSAPVALIVKVIRAPCRRRLQARLFTHEAAVVLESFGI